MNKKRKKRRNTRKKDSGYLLPIVCVVVMTLLSAILITFCISVVLSAEAEAPVTSSTADQTMHTASVPISSALTTPTTVTRESTSPTTPTPPATTPAPTTSSTTPPAPATTTTSEAPVTTEPNLPDPPETTEPPVNPDPPIDPSLGFKADLSEYEKYMNPTGDNWDDAYLLLVNTSHRLESNQEKTYPALSEFVKFSNVEEYDYRHATELGISMNENAIMALTAMFIEAEANGLEKLDITSAYRTFDYQNRLFNNNCARTFHWLCEEEGCGQDWIGKSSTCPICGKKTSNNTLPITMEEKEASVALSSCAPGTSDHQTGLAIDVIDRSLPSRFNGLIQEYGETESGKWLAENSWKFGFVLRFPEGKQDVTGIIYEPWHFRFVGRTHAKQMTELNMTLEEYTVYLESINYFD